MSSVIPGLAALLLALQAVINVLDFGLALPGAGASTRVSTTGGSQPRSRSDVEQPTAPVSLILNRKPLAPRDRR